MVRLEVLAMLRTLDFVDVVSPGSVERLTDTETVVRYDSLVMCEELVMNEVLVDIALGDDVVRLDVGM